MTIMNLKQLIFGCAALAGALGASAFAAAAPKIQFEKTVLDFGTVSVVESVAGVFKYKNIGDALLKIDPPKASCGCTVTELRPDTLKPGESGELGFTLHLGRTRAEMAKHVTITSNDPMVPTVNLTIKVDYIPPYYLEPAALAPDLAFGKDEAEQFAILTRADGKPLKISKIEGSQPWITAGLAPGEAGQGSTAKIRVSVRREGQPRRFNEFVQIYTEGQADIPSATLSLHGQIAGEVAVTPEALYWSVTDVGAAKSSQPESMVVRRLTIRSASGRAFELKNPRSTIPGVQVEVVPKEAGKAYELVARLKDVPTATVGGNVTFETSVEGQRKMEVPVIVNVFQP